MAFGGVKWCNMIRFLPSMSFAVTDDSERRKLMTVFSGTYSHSLDTKNRLFIPARFREELGEKFFVMRNVDGCLDIISIEDRDRLAEKLSKLPRSQSADIKRFLFAAAGDCVADSQGRIVLPQQLIEYAALEKNVCIIGAVDHIEIWDEERYAEIRERFSAESIAAKMNESSW